MQNTEQLISQIFW